MPRKKAAAHKEGSTLLGEVITPADAMEKALTTAAASLTVADTPDSALDAADVPTLARRSYAMAYMHALDFFKHSPRTFDERMLMFDRAMLLISNAEKNRLAALQFSHARTDQEQADRLLQLQGTVLRLAEQRIREKDRLEGKAPITVDVDASPPQA